MRLVNSDPIKIALMNAADGNNGQLSLVAALQVIDDADTEQNIPESHWESGEIKPIGSDTGVPYIKCFTCGNAPLYDGSGEYTLSEYCPFCGAKMYQENSTEITED